jgi:methyl-accepting chemotaxis protein
VEALLKRMQAANESDPGVSQILESLGFAWGNTLGTLRAFLMYRSPKTREEFAAAKKMLESLSAELVAAVKASGDAKAPRVSKAVSDVLVHMDKTVALHAGETWRKDAHLIRTELGPLLASLKQRLQQLVEARTQLSEQVATDADSAYRDSVQASIAAGGLVSLALFGFVWMLSRSIVGPLGQAVEAANRVAKGDLEESVASSGTDEAARLLYALEAMRESLFEARESAARTQAEESGRLRQALASASSSILVTNSSLNIMYVNDSAQALFTSIGFTALVDQPISAVLADEAAALQELHSQRRFDVVLNGHTLDVAAAPIVNADGASMGLVIEWSDRTIELRMEKDIENLVEAGRNGNLDKRLDLNNDESSLGRLGRGLNELIAVNERVLADTSRLFGALAEGNLTQGIDASYQGRYDQLKQDANATLARLTSVIHDIQKIAGSVENHSHTIAGDSHTLHASNQEYTRQLDESRQRLAEVTETGRANAASASQADSVASDARDLANKGCGIVTKAIVAMAEIDESSKRISAITSVIDGLAFQTNLLALNAAVEAARAGEQGRGFAVVASEVRNLASRSASAAREIKSLIVDSTTKVSLGTELITQSGGTLEEIVRAVTQVSEIVSDIATTSQEQAESIRPVSEAVQRMHDTTRQTSDLINETTQAAHAIGNEVEGLSRLVSFFTVDANPQADSKSSPKPIRSAA